MTREVLEGKIRELGVKKGDDLFIHSNLVPFGKFEGLNTKDKLCKFYYDALRNVIGEEGTLCVPTFTYSFSRLEIFSRHESPSNMGIFAEWVRGREDSVRSDDPFYSVSCIGPKANYLTEIKESNSFSENMFFAKFHQINGKILNMNKNAGSTILHYFERKLGVKYRYDKKFNGYIKKRDGSLEEKEWSIWVRDMQNPLYEYDCTLFDEEAQRKGKFKKVKYGLGEIGVIKVDDCLTILRECINEHPYFLTKLGCRN